MTTILVADDEPDIVFLVSRRLTRHGYEVITAADGEEALLMAEEQRPDLALLDVSMPKLTGVEVARRLRVEGTGVRLMPVVLMSAGLLEPVVVPLDADAFVGKPFRGDEILDVVSRVLSRPSDVVGSSVE